MNFLERSKVYEHVVGKVSRRFETYGYSKVRTPAFEAYDLYSEIDSSIPRREMIKVIDPTGDVLVLRPDVTIPITKELSHVYGRLTSERRYYYIQEVFRQTGTDLSPIEHTQAGIEFFGCRSPEADAETIALAVRTLKDLELGEIKIEIGYPALLDSLIQQMGMDTRQNIQLSQLIVSKNVAELQGLLREAKIDGQLAAAVETITQVYGKPEVVAAKMAGIRLDSSMDGILEYIQEVCRLLEIYGCKEEIIIDFGLLNNMDYYSGIIFQGYVEGLGRPVVMGGRYDKLGDTFEADLPGMGFAIEIEPIVDALDGRMTEIPASQSVCIYYSNTELEEAILLAEQLREEQYQVVMSQLQNEAFNDLKAYTVLLKREEKTVLTQEESYQFLTVTDVGMFFEKEA
ncbi:ATP phosphoribosyltransferase regulatory subunit [Sporosarcina sp. NCCP-2222]|uniref:ATP phosphoribosyltransferase regulatory subunit n=1 Tax=Sporosarcina sp. NCCP-2222 TaxID=2935073 RepID=UPI002086BB79|nr:ATP phosphoribosyltransferase regulatory subunit [Sporosarcina sp. NCCP-2222]GKV54721.1 ATP phosphoribosyltransferase regulatory subunit [Sporosarcina sp. NCCP-2222]